MVGSIQILPDGRLQTDYGVMRAPRWFAGELTAEIVTRLTMLAQSKYLRNHRFG